MKLIMIFFKCFDYLNGFFFFNSKTMKIAKTKTLLEFDNDLTNNEHYLNFVKYSIKKFVQFNLRQYVKSQSYIFK